MKTKNTNLEIYYSPITNKWYALDKDGYSLKCSKYPSSVRSFRHLYRAYISASTRGETDRVLTMMRGLK